MSVTMTITGNREYCRENRLVRLIEDSDGTYEEFPYELNISNGNFAAFGASLGIYEQFGEIYPQALLARLSRVRATDLVREEHREGNVIECGLTAEQVSRYIKATEILCSVAERREEKIVWS